MIKLVTEGDFVIAEAQWTDSDSCTCICIHTVSTFNGTAVKDHCVLIYFSWGSLVSRWMMSEKVFMEGPTLSRGICKLGSTLYIISATKIWRTIPAVFIDFEFDIITSVLQSHYYNNVHAGFTWHATRLKKLIVWYIFYLITQNSIPEQIDLEPKFLVARDRADGTPRQMNAKNYPTGIGESFRKW